MGDRPGVGEIATGTCLGIVGAIVFLALAPILLLVIVTSCEEAAYHRARAHEANVPDAPSSVRSTRSAPQSSSTSSSPPSTRQSPSGSPSTPRQPTRSDITVELNRGSITLSPGRLHVIAVDCSGSIRNGGHDDLGGFAVYIDIHDDGGRLVGSRGACAFGMTQTDCLRAGATARFSGQIPVTASASDGPFTWAYRMVQDTQSQ